MSSRSGSATLSRDEAITLGALQGGRNNRAMYGIAAVAPTVRRHLAASVLVVDTDLPDRPVALVRPLSIRDISPRQERSPQFMRHASSRFHADRAAGRDRDHRGPDRPAAARRAGGPRGGPARPVRQQPEAARPRHAQLPRLARHVPDRRDGHPQPHRCRQRQPVPDRHDCGQQPPDLGVHDPALSSSRGPWPTRSTSACRSTTTPRTRRSGSSPRRSSAPPTPTWASSTSAAIRSARGTTWSTGATRTTSRTARPTPSPARSSPGEIGPLPRRPVRDRQVLRHPEHHRRHEQHPADDRGDRRPAQRHQPRPPRRRLQRRLQLRHVQRLHPAQLDVPRLRLGRTASTRTRPIPPA